MIETEPRKGWLARQFTSLTPKQGNALGWGLVAIGCALLIKALLDMWPGMPSTIIRGVLFAVAAIMGYKAVSTVPNLEGYKPWFIPLGAGAFLNWLVVLANGGFMPAALQNTPQGIYIPMAGSNLPYFGDWIFGFISPGDTILFVAFVGLIVTMVGNRKQKAAEGT